MAIDQVELLTQERNVETVLKSLPVKQTHQDAHFRDSLMDSVVKETDEGTIFGESRFARTLLTGLSWVAAALAIGAVIAMTWAGISSYL